MKSWDEHEWYCSKCFENELKQSVTDADEGMTRKAREAMEKRLTGKKTNAKKSEVIHIEDDSNQFYDRSIDIWIDDNGRISKIGKLKQSRIYFDGIGYEDRVDIPDRPEDYEEGGVAEKLIYSHIDIFNEDENRPKHWKSILDISDMPDEEPKDKTAEEISIRKENNRVSTDRYCHHCFNDLDPFDEGYMLQNGDLICSDCLSDYYDTCEICGEYFEKDKMQSWDGNEWYCPDCFKNEFYPFNPYNYSERSKAYQEMLDRLKGKKTDVKGSRTVHIETNIDNDSYHQCIDVTTDRSGKIKEISRYTPKKKYRVGEYNYGWMEMPDKPEDYTEDGKAEQLIRSKITIIEETKGNQGRETSGLTEKKEKIRKETKNKALYKKYGEYISLDPEILFEGKTFVFSGVFKKGQEDVLNIQELEEKGGKIRKQISGITDYLVIKNLDTAAESALSAAASNIRFGKQTQIILVDDLIEELNKQTKKTKSQKKKTNAKADANAEKESSKSIVKDEAAKSGPKTLKTATKKTGTTKPAETAKSSTVKPASKGVALKSQANIEARKQNKKEKTEQKSINRPGRLKRNGFFPAVTRNELLASMNKENYKGAHDVQEEHEWISPRGLWAIKVPVGLSYTMDHTIAREMTKTAEGVGVKCDAQIRMTGHTGSSWSSKTYAEPMDMMIVPTLGTLDIQAISNDLNQEWTMTAINTYLDRNGFDLEGGALKYTSEIAVWYKAEQERLGTKDYIQILFCVFCSGTTMVGGGLIVVVPSKLKELNGLIMGMLKSITKVPQVVDLDVFIPETLPNDFTLKFTSSKDLQIENGVILPIPDGFKGELRSGGKIGQRKCSIIPEGLQFWNGTGDSSYIPLDISMMEMNSDDIPTTPEMVGKIAQQIIQQVAHLGVFNLNGPLYLVRQTPKGSVMYQELSDYGNTDGFALRVITAANNKARICTVRIYIHKRITRSHYNLMLHEAGAMVAAYFHHMEIDGEELYDNGMAPAKSLRPGDAKENLAEHLELVSSPYYTTRRSADFRAQSIRELMKRNGNDTGKAFSLMEIKSDRYDLDVKAIEIAKVFRLNAGLFDQYHDTEAMIRLGIIKEAHSLHALRSLAWTIAVLSENEDREYDHFNFEELAKIGGDIKRARWLNYAVGGREERCKGLCEHEDWHVFYVPEQYLSSDSRKHEDLRVLCGKENRGGNTISFSVPNLGMDSISDKKRIDEIISRNEETLVSLVELRTDLEELLPVMETVYDGFMKGRDRSRELEGPLADILAAWCALSIAAKEPFYSEEAADTPEADAALDEPLKRPVDDLPDNTTLRTQQKQNNARAMSDLEKVIGDSEKILTEAQGSSDRGSVRKAEGLLEDLKNQAGATASAMEIHEANQKRMEVERQERIAKAKAKGKSSKDESFMLALLEIEEAFGFLNRDENEFAERYAEDFPAYSASQLIELRNKVKPQLHDPEMRQAAKEALLTCPVKERFEKTTANCFNINTDWDFNAREAEAIEKTRFWYNSNELDELRQHVKKLIEDSIGSVNRQLTSFNPGWNSFAGVKNDLHISITELKEPIEETHNLFDVAIGEGYHVTVELKHTSMGYLSIPVMNLFASVWKTTPAELWSATMRNSMQDVRGVSGKTKQDAKKAMNQALDNLRKSQKETKGPQMQENGSQTYFGGYSEDRVAAKNRTTGENEKSPQEVWELIDQIAALKKEQDALKGLFAAFKRRRLQKEIDELKERLSKL